MRESDVEILFLQGLIEMVSVGGARTSHILLGSYM